MIRAITYNCQGLKSSIHDIQALCSTYDLIFIQESWLFQFELTLLSEIDSDFEGFGISAIDDSTNIVRGRPYGGMAILIRKQYRSIAQFHTYNCSRLLGVQLTCNDLFLLFISVYMPYQCDDNYELFMEYVSKLSALIEESPTSYVAILDYFNAGIDTQFDASDDSIPVCKIHTHHDYIVPGFNEFAKQLHSEARADYLLWKASGKPRAGLLYLICVCLGLDLSVH